MPFTGCDSIKPERAYRPDFVNGERLQMLLCSPWGMSAPLPLPEVIEMEQIVFVDPQGVAVVQWVKVR